MHLSYQRALKGQISLHKRAVSKSRNVHVDEGIGKSFSRDLTIPHLDLSHFAFCIMGN